MRGSAQSLVLILALACSCPARAQQPAAPSPLLDEAALTRVSEHVYALVGFPNVGFVIGTRATLVVDTGLGTRNGEVVARVAKRLSKGPILYLTTTHFHPEHAAGFGGFPVGTVVIRPRVQQQEIDQQGQDVLARFRDNPSYAPLLIDAVFGTAQVQFDQDYALDLGGTQVRISKVGPAHTLGDEVIWVAEDRTLLSGDLGIKGQAPHYAAGVGPAQWRLVLDRLAALKPLHVVPDHGVLGEASLLSEQREALSRPAPSL